MNFPLLKIRLVICFLNSDVSRSISQTSAASLLKESNSVLPKKKKTSQRKINKKREDFDISTNLFLFSSFFFAFTAKRRPI